MANILSGVDAFIKNSTLSITVLNSGSEPVEGATIKILTGDGQDITATAIGDGPIKTDFNGQYKKLNIVGTVAVGQTYIIRAEKEGYDPVEYGTSTAFDGRGSFKLYLQPAKFSVKSINVEFPNAIVSALEPILFKITIEDNKSIDYVIVRIESDSGYTTRMEVATYGKEVVYVDISGRINLGVTPMVVPLGEVAIEDTYFSDNIRVYMSVMAEGGEQYLNGSVEQVGYTSYTGLLVANMASDKEVNDLIEYATGKRKWITPVAVPSFPIGYYADIMVWLPQTPTGEYFTLHTNYYDSQGGLIESKLSNVGYSTYVQRVAIDQDPPIGTLYITMQIKEGETEITEPIKVYYNYAN